MKLIFKVQILPWIIFTALILYSIVTFFISNPTNINSDKLLLYGTVFVILWIERQAILATFNDSDNGKPLIASVILLSGLFIYVVGRLYPVFDLEILGYFIIASSFVLAYAPKEYLRSVYFIASSGVILAILGRIAPEILSSQLAMKIATATSILLSATILPVIADGVYLYFGPYTAEVTHACSGMNSIFSLFALSLLYLKEGVERKVWHMFSLVMLVIPIAIITNTIRVILLVLTTWYFGEQFSSGPFHETVGVIVFLIALGFLVIVDKLLFLIKSRKNVR